MCAFDPEDRRERCRSKEIECSCCPWMLTHMQSSERADAHAHLHKHNLDWVSQVQNICIHGRFCIGSTTYSVSSNCGTWLSTFTLRRPWTMLECFYGCIYGSVVLVYWIPPTESIFFFLTQITLKNIFKYKKYLKVAFFCWSYWSRWQTSSEYTRIQSVHLVCVMYIPGSALLMFCSILLCISDFPSSVIWAY